MRRITERQNEKMEKEKMMQRMKTRFNAGFQAGKMTTDSEGKPIEIKAPRLDNIQKEGAQYLSQHNKMRRKRINKLKQIATKIDIDHVEDFVETYRSIVLPSAKGVKVNGRGMVDSK
jgi:hypothetical protein